MKIDKSIPYMNILMRCDEYQATPIKLPDGFRFRGYKAGDEHIWAKFEIEIEDFDTYDNAVAYFQRKYLSNPEELQKRLICVESEDGTPAGMVIAWFDKNGDDTISTVHWLVTSPAFQGLGIGKALVQKLLETFYELKAYPVYLHTQPWSYAAIKIYSSLGFKMLRSESILNYENQYSLAIEELKKHLPQEVMEKLISETI